MILDPHRGEDGLIDAVLIGRDFYSLSGPPPPTLPVPVEDFLVPMTEVYASRALNSHHQISVHAASWPKQWFLSMLYRESERSRILVHHSLNRCYTRFAVAIELGNIIMADNVSFATTDIVEHLTGLLSGLVPQRDTPLYGESLALAIAIELLMPMHHRQAMEGFIESGADALTVATAFRVPENIAQWSLAGGWNNRIRLHGSITDVPPVPPSAPA